MLMRSAEFPTGVHAFIRECTPKWHRWVREGCVTSRAFCNDGLRSGDNELGSSHCGYLAGTDGLSSGDYGYATNVNGSGSSEYGYVASIDRKRIAQRQVQNSLNGG